MGTRKNRYSQLIEAIFNQYYENGKEAIQFERTDLVQGGTNFQTPFQAAKGFP